MPTKFLVTAILVTACCARTQYKLTNLAGSPVLDGDGCLRTDIATETILLKFNESSVEMHHSPSVVAADAQILNHKTMDNLDIKPLEIYNGDAQGTVANLRFKCSRNADQSEIAGLLIVNNMALELSFAPTDFVSANADNVFVSNVQSTTGGDLTIGAKVDDITTMILETGVFSDIEMYDSHANHAHDDPHYDHGGSSSSSSSSSTVGIGPRDHNERRLSSPRRLGNVQRWSNCYARDSEPRQFKVGVAIGTTLFKERYGSSTAKTMEEIQKIFSMSNLVYKTQLNIRLVVGEVFIAPEERENPSWDNERSCKAHSLNPSSNLNQFTSWASKKTKYGTWHLLDDCYSQRGGTVGIAWVGNICSSRAAGLSWWTRMHWLTVAHELGHNFGASHSFEEGQGRTGGIMDYDTGRGVLLNGEYQFNSKYRKSQVCRTISRVVSRCSGGFAMDAPTTPTPAPTPLRGCGTKSGAVVGQKCIFPFVHKGVTYNSCTVADDPAGEAWCSTKTDSRGNHVKGNWGHCNTQCGSSPAPAPSPPVPAPSPPAPVPSPTAPVPVPVPVPGPSLGGCTWSVVKQNMYCAGDWNVVRKDVASGVNAARCQQLVAADLQCSDFSYSNNDQCRCVLKGKTCQQRPSFSGNVIYKRTCLANPTNPSNPPPGKPCNGNELSIMSHSYQKQLDEAQMEISQLKAQLAAVKGQKSLRGSKK